MLLDVNFFHTVSVARKNGTFPARLGLYGTMRHIVTIGGGSGHSQVLRALKPLPGIQITAICPSTDSGGSTGTLRASYGGNGYTGDVTKCIVALCEDETLAAALSYRYEEGPLHGHSVKNLLFHALERGAERAQALRAMARLCGLGAHRVLPVTHEHTELCATLRIGNTLSGEAAIDTIARNPLWNPEVHSIADIYLNPAVRASDEALQAVQDAEYLLVCPGDLYSSLIPVLLPLGMRDAIAASSAQIVLVLNIMTKRGETDNYAAGDFIRVLEEKLGRPAGYIFCNDAPIPPEVLLQYTLENKVELAPGESGDPRITFLPLAQVTAQKQVVTDPAVLRAAFSALFARP